MNHIGNQIRIHREKIGMTQMQLSKKLGYTTSQFISNIERGLCSLPEKKHSKITTILGIPEATLKACSMKLQSKKMITEQRIKLLEQKIKILKKAYGK